jgi:hypothetical protein
MKKVKILAENHIEEETLTLPIMESCRNSNHLEIIEREFDNSKTLSSNQTDELELRNIEDEEKDVVDQFDESLQKIRKMRLLDGSMSIIQETDEDIDDTMYNNSIVSGREGLNFTAKSSRVQTKCSVRT